ncbi:unnamed protein product [Brachionus calyciflorus]|uniref:Epidermal growth factor receptor substrate 15-like 1 n=1 Tax=Brachionus calyciflorus TaxID=104777 RepID=A0A813XQE1_9BILA|nr:unnamed protein product [Brachionus calyciflorus]
MAVNVTPSIDEILEQNQIIYDIYFSQADATGSGIIGAYDANNFLKLSKLPPDVLKDIWELSDPTGKGYLDRYAFYLCLKLVSLAQSNQQVKLENLTCSTLAPKLGELSSNITSLITSDDPWYIKASNRILNDKTFDSLSPINNKLSGARVKPFLLKSGLSVDILGKIWELSDLDQDGQLDRDEFLIAMQLVQKAKDGFTIPDQLPPSLLPFKIRHSSISNSTTTNGLPGLQTTPLVNEIKPWVVSVDEKAKSDLIFNQIDTDLDGYVNGGECKDVFLNTGLSPNILANIWALCDIGVTGKLNCEQFALAMHFVNKKLSTGLDPPFELLPEMVPPSLRPKPILIEEAHASKEFEELQTQVTELQREKLYYEQRASEHESQTRLKRTELTNLELEMESIYKTLQERELNKIEENRKLSEQEDKLSKLTTQLNDWRLKFDQESKEIEILRTNIVNTKSQTKNHDFTQIKSNISLLSNEQVSLEHKINSNSLMLNNLNSEILHNQSLVNKNKSKIELLKKLEANLNKLIKEYDLCNSLNDVSSEITKLENENKEIEDEMMRNMDEIDDPFKTTDPFIGKDTFTDQFSPQITNESNPFPDDPFTNGSSIDPFSNGATPDPFADAFDPFKTESNRAKASAPPRPAPPRPQTPSLKPTKKVDFTQRPQSALDFTKTSLSMVNNKIDLFNNFDPFAPTNTAPTINQTKTDPFGAFDWANFSTNNNNTNVSNTKQKDPFDPFA